MVARAFALKEATKFKNTGGDPTWVEVQMCTFYMAWDTLVCAAKMLFDTQYRDSVAEGELLIEKVLVAAGMMEEPLEEDLDE